MIFRKWQRRLQFTWTSLRLIKSTVFPWPSSYLLSYTKETILCRFRIAHTTHSFLFILQCVLFRMCFLTYRKSHCIPSPSQLPDSYTIFHLPSVTFFMTVLPSLITPLPSTIKPAWWTKNPYRLSAITHLLSYRACNIEKKNIL